VTPSEEPQTPLAEAAMQIHELFTTLIAEGFSEWQALRLLGVFLAESMRNSDD
jgi:hypothetical protein